jgi:hypothetical protein
MIFAPALALLIAIMGLVVFTSVFHWGRGSRIKAYAIIAPLPVLAVSVVIYWLSYRSIAFSYEIWNTVIQKVIYYEEWTEEYTDTETYTDSDGNTHTQTVTRYRHHPEYWVAVDEYDTEHDISQGEYNRWKGIWKNEKEVDIFRMDQSSWGDGDKYECYWNNQFETMMPWSFVKTYENKVRCSNTVWNFVDVDKETRKKFPRPADDKNLSPIISYGVSFDSQYDLLLRRWNGLWGNRYEIHNILLLFNANEYPDRSIVETVINAWKGPNKNELVTFVGVKDGEVACK